MPRLPDGKVDLTGPWLDGGSNDDIERDGGLKPGELPLLPWAKELRDKRLTKDEPYTACLPMSVPRHQPVSVEVRDVLHVEGPDAHLRAARDRRRRRASRGLHGRPQAPGRSDSDLVGPLDRPVEKDTLVIDTIGYNDKFWFDARGTPHTEKLHTIERWTRTSFGTMTNDFTLDDPGAFSRPVQLKFTATHIRPDLDLMEFICLEDNEYGMAGGIVPANEGGQRGK